MILALFAIIISMLGIYITAGYPNTATTVDALQVLDQAGVDLIELGVPFSDPMADGPVIQKASYEALKQGMNLDKIFALIDQARAQGVKSNDKKGLNNLILFSYYNPLFVYGFDTLIQECLKHKVSGILIPDLPLEEAEELCTKFKNAGLDLILLAAITSTAERLERIAKLSNPWIYLVSRTGVTGSDQDIKNLQANTDASNTERVKTMIKQIKSYSDKSVALGFGIDSPSKVAEALAAGADMAIIGSKAVSVLEESGITGFEKFIKSLDAKVTSD